MAKAKSSAKRLKVYGAAMGFFDVVVAAANQAEALKAWGVRQNLFAEGAAQVVEDKAAVAAALAQPGQVLRRPIGSDAPFAREPSGAPAIPAGEGRGRPRPTETSAPARTAAPDAAKARRAAAAKAAAAAAEAALEAVEADWKRDAAELAQAKTALEDKAAAARADYLERRKTAKTSLAAARRAVRSST